MTDDTAPDLIPISEPDADPPPSLPPAPGGQSVLVVHRGPAGVGPKRRSFKAKGLDTLTLWPGLNILDGDLWADYLGHEAVASIVEAGEAELVDDLPRKWPELMPLIETCEQRIRTKEGWAYPALDAVKEHEIDRYGDRPRQVVMDAIAKARARLDKHATAKTSVTTKAAPKDKTTGLPRGVARTREASAGTPVSSLGAQAARWFGR